MSVVPSRLAVFLPLCDHSTVYPFVLLLLGLWVVSTSVSGAVTNRTATKLPGCVFWGTYELLLSRKYLGTEITGSRLGLFLIVKLQATKLLSDPERWKVTRC